MDFTVIDFETVNDNYAPCSIGITLIKNFEIIDSFEILINPEDKFNPTHTKIHRITPKMISSSKNFRAVWKEIKSYFVNAIVVAHNIDFDSQVLIKSLRKYNLPIPNFKTLDTVELSQKTYFELSHHNLKSVGNHLNIDFTHHNAKDDSYVAARILLDVIKIHKITCFDDFSKITNNTNDNHLENFITIDENAINDNQFYNRHIAFTGDLGFSRFLVMKKLHSLGGIYDQKVSSSTNFLILGRLNFLTSKLKKTLNLIEANSDIIILTKKDLKKFIDFEML